MARLVGRVCLQEDPLDPRRNMEYVAPGIKCRGVDLDVGAARSTLTKGRAHQLIVYKPDHVSALQLFSVEFEGACSG